MGRNSYSDRRTVDGSRGITIRFLNRHNYFKSAWLSGTVTWSRNDHELGSMGISVSTAAGNEHLCVRYTYTHLHSASQQKKDLDYSIKLVWTPCNYGGRRWWFICPLITNGRTCNRRVTGLYFGNSPYLGCRHCHDLTYASCRESHTFDRLFWSMGMTPQQGKRLLFNQKIRRKRNRQQK